MLTKSSHWFLLIVIPTYYIFIKLSKYQLRILIFCIWTRVFGDCLERCPITHLVHIWAQDFLRTPNQSLLIGFCLEFVFFPHFIVTRGSAGDSLEATPSSHQSESKFKASRSATCEFTPSHGPPFGFWFNRCSLFLCPWLQHPAWWPFLSDETAEIGSNCFCLFSLLEKWPIAVLLSLYPHPRVRLVHPRLGLGWSLILPTWSWKEEHECTVPARIHKAHSIPHRAHGGEPWILRPPNPASSPYTHPPHSAQLYSVSCTRL